MSKPNLEFFFKQYEEIVEKVEAAFEKVKNEYPDLVKCKTGCSDCCHALFDLTLIEAMYISQKARECFSGQTFIDLLEIANRADRKIYKIKKSAHEDLHKGKNEVDILGRMALERVRCPLLNDDDTCRMYAYRPITCRIYGIPTVNNGMSHTCGLSGFKEGESYPTLKMEQLYQMLYDLSASFVESIDTRFIKMADMLVPLSMAILTDYDDAYLGIKGADQDADPDAGNTQPDNKDGGENNNG